MARMCAYKSIVGLNIACTIALVIIQTSHYNNFCHISIIGTRRDNSGISPLKQDGKLHNDPKDKAEILNNQL